MNTISECFMFCLACGALSRPRISISYFCTMRNMTAAYIEKASTQKSYASHTHTHTFAHYLLDDKHFFFLESENAYTNISIRKEWKKNCVTDLLPNGPVSKFELYLEIDEFYLPSTTFAMMMEQASAAI